MAIKSHVDIAQQSGSVLQRDYPVHLRPYNKSALDTYRVLACPPILSLLDILHPFLLQDITVDDLEVGQVFVTTGKCKGDETIVKLIVVCLVEGAKFDAGLLRIEGYLAGVIPQSNLPDVSPVGIVLLDAPYNVSE